MEKKVLIVSTSLRKNSNSERLAEEFAKGAVSEGHQVEVITLRERQIEFCKGCLACQSNGKCVIKDDALEIAEKMKASERAVSGLQGWIDCFERARLMGTVFAGGVTEAGKIDGHESLQQAYKMGMEV